MGNIAIKVEGLSKKYIIGKQKQNSLYHSIANLWKNNIKGKEDFWALKDVSFNVKEGEVLGIIGKNGAGKSTLLKILSRITEPTKGRVITKGRVTSLLEVGTGFHPELTGRENIFLNGSILGMKRQEIRNKFDEIVDFSGVKGFIDTPVKNYSSGMYVRLAFSIAAHLEPEILIIDEVLAVGDIDFQRKCINKIGRVNKENGKTVLFVSHNMGVVSALCNCGLLLSEGQVVSEGLLEKCIYAYIGGDKIENNHVFNNNSHKDIFQINGIKLLSIDKKTSSRYTNLESITIEIDLSIVREVKNLKIGVHLINLLGIEVLTTFNTDTTDQVYSKGRHKLEILLPDKIFNQGNYYLAFSIGIHKIKWFHHKKIVSEFSIDFVTSNPNMLGKNKRKSIIAPLIEWNSLKM